MRVTHKKNLLAAILAGTLGLTSAQAQTEALKPPCYQYFADQLLYQRAAFEALFWALPVADSLVVRRAQVLERASRLGSDGKRSLP
jgi:hypothetical protein